MDLGSLTKGAAPAKGDQYDEVIETMKDPERSTFAFVMYPEYTPMMEAYRAAADLEDQVGIETSLVVANYLLPEEYGDNAFFANRHAQQAQYQSITSEGPRLRPVAAKSLSSAPR